MNELSLMWHIVLGLQGHITVKEELHGTEVNAECMVLVRTEQKAWSSVYCGKLAVMAMPELTTADSSIQTLQLQGRHELNSTNLHTVTGML